MNKLVVIVGFLFLCVACQPPESVRAEGGRDIPTNALIGMAVELSSLDFETGGTGMEISSNDGTSKILIVGQVLVARRPDKEIGQRWCYMADAVKQVKKDCPEYDYYWDKNTPEELGATKIIHDGAVKCNLVMDQISDYRKNCSIKTERCTFVSDEGWEAEVSFWGGWAQLRVVDEEMFTLKMADPDFDEVFWVGPVTRE